jgi:GT2 family glycosyltransferase
VKSFIWIISEKQLMNKKEPKVAIIMTTWNGLKDTQECLNSFKKVIYPNFHLIIVDNGSKVDEASILRKEYKKIFPNLTCLRTEKNYGYIGGCNIGLRYAMEKINPTYLLIMNNDVLVDPTFLTNLVSAMEADDSVGMASPKIYCYPERRRIMYDGVYKINLGWRFQSIWKPTKKTSETDFVTACCLLVKSNVIKQVGFPDPRFFLTAFDTVEYSLRAKRKGFKLFFVPSSKIWHKLSRAAISWDFTRRYKFEIEGFVYCCSLRAKAYQLPSLIFFYFLIFLKNRLEGLMELLFSARKREIVKLSISKKEIVKPKTRSTRLFQEF